MANITKAVPENVAGDFFVDETCIDCGTCRHIAPQIFGETNEYSYVQAQPEDACGNRQALQALLSCPTGSIGTQSPKPELKQVRDTFPIHITENIYYNGFTSPRSYGASSYLIEHPEGNWLVDCPKFIPSVVKALEEKGGVAYIFLTHSDDVADATEFAKHFNAKRIIHREELWSAPESEIVLDGEERIDFAPGFQIIPVPGHTKGSCCLLYDNRFLFSGDHCSWDAGQQALRLPQYYYWDKKRMASSHENLMTYGFEWVLPGHGMGVHLKNPQTTF